MRPGEKMKPNCYDCKWRGAIAGDTNSRCNHPANDEIVNNPFAQVFGIIASVGRIGPVKVDTGLHVTGEPDGIKNGWFVWPISFDPLWLKTCDGFEQKVGQ
jgi:hypothetical protein